MLHTSHLPRSDDIGVATLRRDVDFEGPTSGANLGIFKAREHCVGGC